MKLNRRNSYTGMPVAFITAEGRVEGTLAGWGTQVLRIVPFGEKKFREYHRVNVFAVEALSN